MPNTPSLLAALSSRLRMRWLNTLFRDSRAESQLARLEAQARQLCAELGRTPPGTERERLENRFDRLDTLIRTLRAGQRDQRLLRAIAPLPDREEPVAGGHGCVDERLHDRVLQAGDERAMICQSIQSRLATEWFDQENVAWPPRQTGATPSTVAPAPEAAVTLNPSTGGRTR